jgi:putative SOS response-associated peptidase YedK
VDGQRGIVLFKTFNEAPHADGPTVQHTITPGDEKAFAAAFVWRAFKIPGEPMALHACVLVTVPANQLLMALPTDRMPAFLAAEDWDKWLGNSQRQSTN